MQLALGAMILLGVVSLVQSKIPQLSIAWLAGVLGLLALNLIAAIISKPQFRRQASLLIFHVCLLAIVLLSAWGVLTRFQGTIEIVEGAAFDADGIMSAEQGPWHKMRLNDVVFSQGPVEVKYGPRLVRDQTKSTLNIFADGATRPIQIGDTRSYRSLGYRFVTTSNKGYAVLLTWIDENGTRVSGAVHMPSFPALEWKQQNQWQTPPGQVLQLKLMPDSPPLDQAWTMTGAGTNRILEVAHNDRYETLHPGDTMALEGGTLIYDEMRMWIGYRIDYNIVLPWAFFASVTGILALAWHFWINGPRASGVTADRGSG